MRIEHDEKQRVQKRPVGHIPSGTAIINGEGNLCMVTRHIPTQERGKVMMVRLDDGRTYEVLDTCEYIVVEAEVTWRHITGC